MKLDEQLVALRADLLHGLRVPLTPEQGRDAFERHQLLAIRFHRAARLNAPGEGEKRGWVQYFREHFPRGDEHAEDLWIRWRIALLKDEYPGTGVAISHGQPHGHWRVLNPSGLFINLESMWDDFEQSVASFVALLARDDERRKATLGHWSGHQWSVQPQSEPAPSRPTYLFPVSASVAASATAMGPMPEPRDVT